MDYINVKDAAQKWDMDERRVRFLCSEDRVPGAKQLGRQWMIPANAPKPVDKRTKVGKAIGRANVYHYPLIIYSITYATQDELDEDYKLLLEAQIDYLKGDYFTCEQLCKKLLVSSGSPYIKAGCYTMIAYSSLVLGLATQFSYYLDQLEKLTEAEENYKDDFKLLVAGIRYNISWDPSCIDDIDIGKLSYEALINYQALRVMSIAINKTDLSRNIVSTTDCISSYVDYAGIAPLSILMHSIIASNYRALGDINRATYHIKMALDVAIENDWLNYLSKYYLTNKGMIDEMLGQENAHIVQKLDEYGFRNLTNFRIVTHQEVGINFLDNLPVDFLELIVLLPYGKSDQENIQALGVSKQKYDSMIKTLLKKLSISTKEELVNYYVDLFKGYKIEH